MRPIATDGSSWSVYLVCLLVAFVKPAKTAEPIKMLFWWVTYVGPRNHVLDGGQDPSTGRSNFGGCSAH